MMPFNQNESAYTGTAKYVSFPAVVTQTTVGSTQSLVNVVTTFGLTPGQTVIVGSEQVVIQSLTGTSITPLTPLSSAPSANVNVSLAYLYDPAKLDNPPRRKANFAVVSTNIRNYQAGYSAI